MKQWLPQRFLLGLFMICAATLAAQKTPHVSRHWVATWAISQDLAPTTPDRPVLPPEIKMPDFSGRGPRPPRPLPTIADNQTIRMIVHAKIAGENLRIELSNAFGKSQVTIGDAHIALRTNGSSIDSATDRQLTFSGSKIFDLRPGALIVSDPVQLNVPPESDLAISLYVVNSEGPPSNHMLGLHTTYISTGDTTASASMPDATTNTSYLWLRSVDVDAPAASYAIACLGDSITDGFKTTVDSDQDWPSLLAKRLNERKSGPRISVINEGISGNEVLHDGAGVSALARFDRDIVAEPGVRWIVLLEGINDINIHGQITGPGALTAEDLIEGYRQILARAHMHGMKVMGATLTPESGVWLAGPTGEATRLKVNQWIRTSGEFDAVVDFDAVVRDSADPSKMRAEFDSHDHIHPNDAGNAAMANAIDLTVFDR